MVAIAISLRAQLSPLPTREVLVRSAPIPPIACDLETSTKRIACERKDVEPQNIKGIRRSRLVKFSKRRQGVVLRFGRQRQRREERAHLVTMESKKDAFRKYLEGAGVIDAITKGRGETSGAQRVRSEAREPWGGEGRRTLRSPSLRS